MDHDSMFRYKTGKAGPDERKKFEEWLVASEANYGQYTEWERIWDISGQAYSDLLPDINQTWAKFSTRLSEDKSPILFRKSTYRVAAAAVILLLLTVGGAYLMRRSGLAVREQYLTYRTVDDTLHISLNDGTQITLNDHSVLRVPSSFTGDDRHVEVSGEAYFNVTHDESHPFSVYSGSTVTKVLGTSFNVLSRDSTVRVSLISGKVSFTSLEGSQHSLILLPGQHGIFDPANHMLSKDSTTGMNGIAWKTRRLVFREAPMDELCLALSDFYKIRFETTDTLHEGRFTGILEDLKLEQAINIIELTMDVRTEKTEAGLRFLPLAKPQINN